MASAANNNKNLVLSLSMHEAAAQAADNTEQGRGERQ
jgi:hypothetical protein